MNWSWDEAGEIISADVREFGVLWWRFSAGEISMAGDGIVDGLWGTSVGWPGHDGLGMGFDGGMGMSGGDARNGLGVNLFQLARILEASGCVGMDRSVVLIGGWILLWQWISGAWSSVLWLCGMVEGQMD